MLRCNKVHFWRNSALCWSEKWKEFSSRNCDKVANLCWSLFAAHGFKRRRRLLRTRGDFCCVCLLGRDLNVTCNWCLPHHLILSTKSIKFSGAINRHKKQETRKSDQLWIRNMIALVLAFAMGRMKIMQYLYLVAKNPIKALLSACSSL